MGISEGRTMINPYIANFGQKFDGIPVKRNTEREAVQEGFAVMKANGFRLRRKGRQMIKTKMSRLTQREAA
jgi:hypothetical protein